jgi:RNA polymerase sigma-70 factor (ECF subfamily)
MVAWRRLDKIPDGNEALPWLYGVARNIVRRIQRSNRRRFRLVAKAMRQPAPTGSDLEVQVVAGIEYDELVASIRRLSEMDQEVIRLRAWEDLTAREIAGVLGCSVSAAEKRITRAFGRLETLLTNRARTRAAPATMQEEGVE